MSRQSTYTQEIADAICAGLADGMSLRKVCEQDGFPSEATVRRWALDNEQGFSAQYTRARAAGAQIGRGNHRNCQHTGYWTENR